MKTIRGIVFDFGGVISAPQDPEFFPRVQALTGWTRETVLAGWRCHRSGMDADTISAQELYRRMAADLGTTLSREEVETLARLDFDSWAHANPATLAWARTLRDEGRRIGILTNMPTDFLPWFDRCAADFRALADAEVVSGAERIIKPDPAIYALLAQRIGLPPETLLFFDDTQTNVDAARACGWQAHRFVSVPDAQAALTAFETRP